jgi:hypothetical protein
VPARGIEGTFAHFGGVRRASSCAGVGTDFSVAVDTNAYSAPWRLLGGSVEVQITRGRVRILHAGDEVALHDEWSFSDPGPLRTAGEKAAQTRLGAC